MPKVLLFMKGPFSQFHPSHFTLGGHAYICAEQYMHEQKARLFGDVAMAERILKSDSPHEHKLMGGRVSGFDQQVWDANKVRIVTEGLIESVRLSSRYIPARQLPDKAVSLLDTACARVAMSQTATPPAVEDRRRTIQLTETELAILELTYITCWYDLHAVMSRALRLELDDVDEPITELTGPGITRSLKPDAEPEA